MDIFLAPFSISPHTHILQITFKDNNNKNNTIITHLRRWPFNHVTIGPGDLGSIPGRVIAKTLKMVLDTLLLKTQQYKVRIRSNPGKGVAPSPTPRCSSYWKGRLLVPLYYGRQLYLLLFLVLIWIISLFFLCTVGYPTCIQHNYNTITYPIKKHDKAFPWNSLRKLKTPRDQPLGFQNPGHNAVTLVIPATHFALIPKDHSPVINSTGFYLE